jgi:hypothetical protein
MADRQATTQTLAMADAGRDFPKLVKQVAKHGRRVQVDENGIQVASIVSARDLQRLTELDAQRRQDFAVIDELRAAFRDVPPEQIEREVAKALAEVRQEMRRERDGR